MTIMTKQELLDRIDGIFAYDDGCLSSGIKDETFKQSLKDREDIKELNIENNIVKVYIEVKN